MQKINKKSLLLINILLWWKCIKRWPSNTTSVVEHTLMVLIINHLAIPGLRVIMRNHSNSVSLILCLFLYFLLRAWNSWLVLYLKSGLFFQDCETMLWISLLPDSYSFYLSLGNLVTSPHFTEKWHNHGSPWAFSTAIPSLEFSADEHIIIYPLRLANEPRKQI